MQQKLISTCTMCGNPIYAVEVSSAGSVQHYINNQVVQIPTILRTCECKVSFQGLQDNIKKLESQIEKIEAALADSKATSSKTIKVLSGKRSLPIING